MISSKAVKLQKKADKKAKIKKSKKEDKCELIDKIACMNAKKLHACKKN